MPAPAALLFDRFELQPTERRLLRDGEPVTLRARAFDLLQALAERAGSLVSKAELLDLVWPGVVVEENNIAAQIASLRKSIGDALIATVPGRGYRFAAEVRRAGAGAATSAPPAAAVAARAVIAVPAAQALFGRDGDRDRVRAMLGEAGCVTMVGPGGVGKTALAKAVAATWTASRIVWVDLAALGDGSELDGALCRALQMAEPASSAGVVAAIAQALAASPALLILDNAEHLIDAVAATVAALTATSPSLSLLVTSQVPLRIAGERVHALEPLALPTADEPDDEARATPSVQMLVDRIRAASPRFEFGADALAQMRLLCARLDGLPLAIEMAAAMVPLLGLLGVIDALDQRLAALVRGRRDAPARHRTLRAAMEWSHSLLGPIEQRVFRSLGVLASDFSLDLAVGVAAENGEDRWAVVDVFAELVDRSLVASLNSDPPRYRLLETTRRFALEQLRSAGDDAAAHARALRSLSLEMKQAADSGASVVASSPEARDLANVPEVLARARAVDPAGAIALAVDACSVATWTPWLGEAVHWIENCEPLLGAGIPLALQAAWWRQLARVQTFVRGARSVEAARRAAAIERERDDPLGLFWSLVPLLRSRLIDADEFAAAEAEARALLDAHPDWPPRLRALFSGSLAMEYRRRGDFETALAHQLDEADQADRAGLATVAANAHSNVAATLVGLGRFDQAHERLDALIRADDDGGDPIAAHNRVQRLQALIGLGRFGDARAAAADALVRCRRHNVLDVLQVLALLAASDGRPRIAAMLLGHHRQSLKARDASLPDDRHAPWREALRLVETVLDPAQVEVLVAAGERLSPAAADRLAVEDADDVGSSTVDTTA